MISARMPANVQTPVRPKTVAPSPPKSPVDTFVASKPSDPGIYKPAPPTRVAVALTNPAIKAEFSKAPAHIQAQVTNLSDAQLRVLKGGISGTTDVGPMTVDNREAFINGRVLLKSIWGNVHDSIKDARLKWNMINPTEEDALHHLIDDCSELSKDQRRQLAGLLDMVR